MAIYIDHQKKIWNFIITLLKNLPPILLNLDKNNKDVILAGDFNIDLLKINQKHIISKYFDMLTSNSFYPKKNVPTRLKSTHGTLIDNILCKLTDNTLDITSEVLIKMFSDNQPYLILLSNILTKDSRSEYVKITKQDK